RAGARSARTSRGSRRTWRASSSTTSAVGPSSGTCTSRIGRATRGEAVRIAMLSPYALTRPGGVQGQVIGLSRALRGLGHDVTVVCPADPGHAFPESLGEHYVIGRATGVHSNGSVAPVALRPAAVAHAERFVRNGGFDVVHIHEPLAPMAAYGLVVTDRCRWSARITVQAFPVGCSPSSSWPSSSAVGWR